MKQVVETARDLLTEHDLSHIDIVRSKAKTFLGQAVFYQDPFGQTRPVQLKLSETWLTRVGEDEVRDTILHEIAHFKAGLKAGHGRPWKEACRAIGAVPERLARLEGDLIKKVQAETAKYHLTCKDCGNVHYRNRLPRGRKSFAGYRCGKCSGPLKEEVKR